MIRSIRPLQKGRLMFNLFALLPGFERDVIREGLKRVCQLPVPVDATAGRPKGLPRSAGLTACAAERLYREANKSSWLNARRSCGINGSKTRKLAAASVVIEGTILQKLRGFKDESEPIFRSRAEEDCLEFPSFIELRVMPFFHG